MKRIGVLCSGGDTPGMNAAVRSVVMKAHTLGMEVLGIRHGYRGLLEGQILPLSAQDVRGISHLGGTVLKTARCKAFEERSGQMQGLVMAKAFDLEGIVAIGGDGTLRGAAEFSEMGVPMIGLPGTIDNDMAYTDFTIGFDTAVNGIMLDLNRVWDTMLSHDRVGVVEVMGRACGNIALWAGLAGEMDFILTPEAGFDIEALCAKLRKDRITGRLTSMIMVAEGVGSGEDIAQAIRERTDIEVKSVVLGYTQRGGSPTVQDRILAARLGQRAVELLYNDQGNRAVGMKDGQLIDLPLDEATAKQRNFDQELLALAKLLSE